MNYINTQTGDYPVSETHIRATFPNVSFPTAFVPPDEYALVFPAPQPVYNRTTETLTEGPPVLTVKGHYEQTWTTVALDPEVAAINVELERLALIEAKCKQVDIERDLRIANDFLYDFGETVAIDDFGVQIAAGIRALQMKDKDRNFWETLRGSALTAVVSGVPATVMYMRSADNWNIQTTAIQVLQVLAAASQRGALLVSHAGSLKSQLRTSNDPASIDITAGWPS